MEKPHTDLPLPRLEGCIERAHSKALQLRRISQQHDERADDILRHKVARLQSRMRGGEGRRVQQ